MCSMTWSRSSEELALCFNRDEQHSRADALPPQVWKEGFLAPVDATAGGTWLAVRRDGRVLALLNHYPQGFKRRGQAVSRGNFVAALAASSVEPSAALMEDCGLRRTNPFRLVVLGLRQPTLVLTWNGRRLARRRLDGDVGFVTSSSWNTRSVTAGRRALFRKWWRHHLAPGLDAMRDFHSDPTHPRGSAWAVCMSRDDARSVSLNTVRLTLCAAEMTQQLRARDADSFSGARHRARLSLSMPA